MTLKREAWVTYGALVPVVAGVVIASGVKPLSLFYSSSVFDSVNNSNNAIV